MKIWILLLLLIAQPSLRAAAAADLEFVPIAHRPDGETSESSLFRAADGTVYLTWIGPGGRAEERALRFASLAPQADRWSDARTIVSTPRLMANWADFATLAVGTDGTLWAQWYQNRPEPQRGYDGWLARSTDDGDTWSEPAPLGHEFVSLAPLSGGRMLAVWLESTRLAGSISHEMHAHVASGPPSMRLISRLLTADGAPVQDWVIDPDVCTCCQTTLAVLSDNHVLVAYRGHTPEEIRDNHVARFDGITWLSPEVLHDDGWHIAACPVNGPAADAAGQAAAVAWFTAAEGQARVQAKFSSDGGRSFGAAQVIDLGHPIGRLDLVSLADGSAVVSWLEGSSDDHVAGLYVRRIFPNAPPSEAVRLVDTTAARASGFARMATRPGASLPVVVAWTATTGQSPAGKPITSVNTGAFFAADLRAQP